MKKLKVSGFGILNLVLGIWFLVSGYKCKFLLSRFYSGNGNFYLNTTFPV